jgi:hypothetical protein
MKKFILITFIILLVGLFAFHFFAANQAEKEINEAIQQQVEASGASLSVQYSSIEVSPFSGDILFKDVTITEQTNIERTRAMNVDLAYLDFLNIYLGGVQYGLKQLTTGNITLSKISYLDRTSLQEFSMDTLNIRYSGNMWDAIQSIAANRRTAYAHQVDLSGTNGKYTKPQSSVGTFTADSAFSKFKVPKGATQWSRDGVHNLTFKNVLWSPPSSFQNNYGFFIQGFGYQLDAIPFKEMGGSYSMTNNSEIMVNEGIASNELFTAKFDGTIETDSTWADAEFSPLNISLVDLSSQFKNVITNIEQLLGLNLPAQSDGIHFQLVGPVSNPSMQQGQ